VLAGESEVVTENVEGSGGFMYSGLSGVVLGLLGLMII